MALEVGIVGLPNTGKSTLFGALTRIKAEAANYPFCTIDPNVGIVRLRDPRMDRLNELVDPEKVVNATLHIVDIAGLVKGASKGEGLGNKFLSHIQQVQAVAHVVRCFSDPNIVHVEGTVDPVSDVKIVQTELILSDIEKIERKIERLSTLLKSDRNLVVELNLFKRLRDYLSDGNLACNISLTEDELLIASTLNLLTIKPYLYIANVSEDELENPGELQSELQELADLENVELIPICAKVESELNEMDIEETKFFMEELGIKNSGLDKLIVSGYKMLKQITFFTAGKKEVKAWEILNGSTAEEAAGKIHTDFRKGFIRAEVFHFDDLDHFGSEASVKEAGKWRLEGKDYVVKDGDVMHFRFNV